MDSGTEDRCGFICNETISKYKHQHASKFTPEYLIACMHACL